MKIFSIVHLSFNNDWWKINKINNKINNENSFDVSRQSQKHLSITFPEKTKSIKKIKLHKYVEDISKGKNAATNRLKTPSNILNIIHFSELYGRILSLKQISLKLNIVIRIKHVISIYITMFHVDKETFFWSMIYELSPYKRFINCFLKVPLNVEIYYVYFLYIFIPYLFQVSLPQNFHRWKSINLLNGNLIFHKYIFINILFQKHFVLINKL